MPEYLSPGVYVEEVSFRSKSIEGVATSTTGFVGLTHFGPVAYAGGPVTCSPRVVTSFTEFERVYGGLSSLRIQRDPDRPAYLAHAARVFFVNGGKRLYVSRVFSPETGSPGNGVAGFTYDGTSVSWRARWPGSMGNVWISTQLGRSKNVAAISGNVAIARSARHGSVIEIGASPSIGVDANQLAVVSIDGSGAQSFVRNGQPVNVPEDTTIQILSLQVTVHVDAERRDTYSDLSTDRQHKRFIGNILQRDNPEDEDAAVWLDVPATMDGATLLSILLSADGVRLAGGNDGDIVPGIFEGREANPDSPPSDPMGKATGLAALGVVSDVAIVAVPDAADLGDRALSFVVHQALIAHCETLKYRIAVVDSPRAASLNAVREYRGQFDSKYAAFYHPWIEILDPTERSSQGAPPRRLVLPPSGFVAGIYARNDLERGVHKAPANEIVRGLTKFEFNINKGRQDVLNPEGINALRFFEGRGNRVWGARTMSSDPEWKYVNVRRFFIYLEHSIDRATQWAVFEPNNERLWANVRNSIEDFLRVEWRNGALLGSRPEEAFFVRCDRTTMQQSDLDNGRLICLVGVAPVKPAEFVIFRVGQWTSDSPVS